MALLVRGGTRAVSVNARGRRWEVVSGVARRAIARDSEVVFMTAYFIRVTELLFCRLTTLCLV